MAGEVAESACFVDVGLVLSRVVANMLDAIRSSSPKVRHETYTHGATRIEALAMAHSDLGAPDRRKE